MKFTHYALIVCVGFVWVSSGFGQSVDNKSADPARSKSVLKKSVPSSTTTITPENEAEALAFVLENAPELAKVLAVLKPMDPVEYRKAITELYQVSKNLGELKIRNPKRYEYSLEAWKTRSRVELLAAQLAGAPSEELRSQLRLAIEAKVDAEIRRQRFELEQAEAAAKRARETLERLETNRQTIVDARFRALTPKKPAKTKKPADSKPVVTPAATPTSSKPANPDGEDRK